MAKENKTAEDTSGRELVVSRMLNAPRDLVYKVWTDPKHIAQWWGPDGFTNTIIEMDVRPGGISRLIMHGPNGVDYPNRIIYTEVIKPERLVYMHGSDIDDDPNQFETTITFEAKGNKTLLTMRAVFVSVEEFQKVVREYGALEGNKQTLNRLEELLSKLQEENVINN
jgi:uncharacterized protein YndB with AHSA1/START domain